MKRKFEPDPYEPTSIDLVGKSLHQIKMEVITWAYRYYGSSYIAASKLQIGTKTMWKYFNLYIERNKS